MAFDWDAIEPDYETENESEDETIATKAIKPKPKGANRAAPKPATDELSAVEELDQLAANEYEPLFPARYIQGSDGNWYPEADGPQVKGKVQHWLHEDGLYLISCWSRDLTFAELANRMGIVPATLRTWCQRYDEIRRAVRYGAEIVDYRVENALLKRAEGYTTSSVTTTIEHGRVTKVVKERKEIPPDVNAAMSWLNNRKHEAWHRNRDLAQAMGEDGDTGIHIVVTRANGNNPADDNEAWEAEVQPTNQPYVYEPDTAADAKPKRGRKANKQAVAAVDDEGESW